MGLFKSGIVLITHTQTKKKQKKNQTKLKRADVLCRFTPRGDNVVGEKFGKRRTGQVSI